MAMSASSSAVGISCTLVSATKTTRPLAKITCTPMGRWPARRVQHLAHVVEHGGVIAGHAGHHRVGIARRQHRGGIDVAVVGDHAHAVAVERAAPLQALVERVDIGRGFLGGMGHADFEAAFVLDAGLLDAGA